MLSRYLQMAVKRTLRTAPALQGGETLIGSEAEATYPAEEAVSITTLCLWSRYIL